MIAATPATRGLYCRYEPVKKALAGLIFDSAPCYMTPQTGRTALTEGLRFPFKQLLQALFMLTVPITMLLKIPQRFWCELIRACLRRIPTMRGPVLETSSVTISQADWKLQADVHKAPAHVRKAPAQNQEVSSLNLCHCKNGSQDKG